MTFRHYYVQKWKVQQYKFSVIECMMRPFDYEGGKQDVNHLKNANFLKNKQYYYDVLMLLFQPLPYYDPIFTITCINYSDKT